MHQFDIKAILPKEIDEVFIQRVFLDSFGVEAHMVSASSMPAKKNVILWDSLYIGKNKLENWFIEDLNYNDLDQDRRSLLMVAIENEDWDAALYLIKKKADVNVFDKSNCTTLMYADVSVEVSKALLEAGADPNLGYFHGKSALILAAEGSDTQIVDAMIEHGADTLKRSHAHNRTPLMHAVIEGNVSNVEYLARKKLDVTSCDNDGRPALWHASRHCDTDIIKVLLENGVGECVFKKDNHKVSALDIVMKRERKDLIKLMVAASA